VFGTLKPHTCRLGCDRAHEYQQFYCGLCKSLGDSFGTLTRALLNYDAVFLALVADGLVETAAAPDRCRCPLLPVTFRPTVRPDSPAMRYAAAMQMLLSDQWLADRAEDGRRVAQAARPLLSGKVEAARAILAELGISLDDLEGFEHRQARCEIPGVTAPREAAEPTASALAVVFERMALLPGVPAETRLPEARAALAAFGRHLGSVIYLIDALDDLEKDHLGGAFNPCLARPRRGGDLRVSWPRVEAAWGLLHDALAALLSLVETLPLRRHRELVRNVVAAELPRLARAAAARAHAYARTEERAQKPARARGWPARALAAVATAFVLAWVWLSSIPALAQKSPKRLPDAGAGDAGPGKGSVVPPHWEPRLPASSSAAPPDKPRPPGSATPKDPPGPGGTTPPPPGTSTPGGGGGGCTNPCSACGSTGGGANPCSGCSSCFGAGKSCDCGGCCNVCDSCNNCCGSLNGGCGSCCK
jgi:hypothetical protein